MTRVITVALCDLSPQTVASRSPVASRWRPEACWHGRRTAAEARRARGRRLAGPLLLAVPEGAEDAEEDGGEDDDDADDAGRRYGVVVEQAGDQDGQTLPGENTWSSTEQVYFAERVVTCC